MTGANFPAPREKTGKIARQTPNKAQSAPKKVFVSEPCTNFGCDFSRENIFPAKTSSRELAGKSVNRLVAW
jgi:hypothetical protein